MPLLLLLASCGEAAPAPRLSRAALPATVHFQTSWPGPAQPNCDPTPPSATGVAPAGGPAPTQALAVGAGLLAYADCDEVSVSSNGGVSWTQHLLPVDLTGLGITGPGHLIGLGQSPVLGLPQYQLRSTNAGASWSVTRTSLSGATAPDSVACSATSGVCVAYTPLVDSWESYCAPGMGAPPPPARQPTPVLVRDRGGSWTTLRGAPSNFLANSATVTASGVVAVAGSVGGAGILLLWTSASSAPTEAIRSPIPLTAVSFRGAFGMVVGGNQDESSCWDSVDLARDQEQIVYATSDYGRSWNLTLESHRAHYPLTGVLTTGPGTALIEAGFSGGVETSCGNIIGGCLRILLATADSGRRLTGYGTAARPGLLQGVQLLAGSGSEAVLALAGNQLLRGERGGTTWTTVAPLSAPTASADFFQGTEAGVVSVDIGDQPPVQLETSDGGRSWQRGPKPDPYVGEITWASPRVGYGIADNGRLVETTDRGGAWRSIPFRYTHDQVYQLHFQSPLIGWAELEVGRTTSLIATRDGGRHWTNLGRVAPSTVSIAGLVAGGTEEFVLVGLNRWELAGAALKAAAAQLVRSGQITAVAIQPGGFVWAAGSHDGHGWLEVTGGHGHSRRYRHLPWNGIPSEIGFTTASFGWMVVDGQLFTTRDAGVMWAQITVPATY